MLPHSGPMSEQVALFHPHPTSAAWLGFLYATKDGRIRAFRFDRPETSEELRGSGGRVPASHPGPAPLLHWQSAPAHMNV